MVGCFVQTGKLFALACNLELKTRVGSWFLIPVCKARANYSSPVWMKLDALTSITQSDPVRAAILCPPQLLASLSPNLVFQWPLIERHMNVKVEIYSPCNKLDQNPPFSFHSCKRRRGQFFSFLSFPFRKCCRRWEKERKMAKNVCLSQKYVPAWAKEKIWTQSYANRWVNWVSQFSSQFVFLVNSVLLLGLLGFQMSDEQNCLTQKSCSQLPACLGRGDVTTSPVWLPRPCASPGHNFLHLELFH